MSGPKRQNRVVTTKTFRFDPDLVDDMEKVMFFTMNGTEPKYPSLNNLVIVALQRLIKEERRKVENQGVAWDSLRPGFKQHQMLEE